jgi:hypothetical protein
MSGCWKITSKVSPWSTLKETKTQVDDLAKAAARNSPIPIDVFFQVMEEASIKTVEPEPRLINIIEEEDW